jgi:hypothetical protein
MMKIVWYGALAVQVEHAQAAVDEKENQEPSPIYY